MRFRLKRLFTKADWLNLRRTSPISTKFGFDRGTPIDRVYINDFLNANKSCIHGSLCEIAENSYSKKYGTNVTQYNVLHYTQDNEQATIIGDLCNVETLPENSIDCFILTQTLNFIEDVDLAIKGVHFMLRDNGVALITVAGLCQISRYDMDQWGDYWRFTNLSLQKILERYFKKDKIVISTYGNVLAATALLHGLSAEELKTEELFYHDQDYQIIITAKVEKS